MFNIERFRDHKINEALGIIEATLDCVDVIKSDVVPRILDFTSTNPSINKVESKQIIIPYQQIKRFVSNWDLYAEFPVSEIILELSMAKKIRTDIMSTNPITKRKKLAPFIIGAYASSFAGGAENKATRMKDPIKLNIDHSISIHMGIDFEYSSFFRKDRHMQILEMKIESLILHELNHLYESYIRKLKGEREFEYSITWTALAKNVNRPKKIWEYWQNFFTDYVYMSEPHEIRAFIQESKAYVDKLSFKSFRRTKAWKIAKVMKNFDYKKFISEFNEAIKEHNPEYVDDIIDVLVNDFKKEYKKLSIEYKEDNIINPDWLAKLSTKEFFEFWEKKIREAGTTLYKNMIRLYSYKDR